MNILFVIKKEIYSAQEPLGILYLSAIAKEKGHKVFLSDSSLDNISKYIREKDIGLVGISCMNIDYQYYLDISKKIKKIFPQITIIWGGPTPTYSPDIIFEEGIDIICRGEGEIAFAELLDRLQKNEDIKNIFNLWIKDKTQVYKNDVGPLVDNLDTLPLPDHDLPLGFTQFKHSKIKFLMASRGCPFNCSYCFNRDFKKLYQGKGAIIRTRSVDNLISELLLLKNKYKANFFYFQDDIFPFQEDWLADFSAKYASKIGLPFTVLSSVAVANENYVKHLKAAGCVSMHLAVENGNEKLRREILNKPITNEQIIKAVVAAKKYGLAVCTFNMIGIPFSNFDDELETLDLNLKAGVDVAYVYFCLPFLNTKLGMMAKEAGLISEDTQFNSYFARVPIKIDNPKRLEKFSYFFPIIISYPFLRPYLGILLKLPIPNIFLRFLKDIINGYYIKKKIIPTKFSFKEFSITTFYFIIKRFTK